MQVEIKRAYDAPAPGDGYRVLADRLWPRGVKKSALPLDEWCKDIAPSQELRVWFAHDPAKFDEFTVRYTEELAANDMAARQLLERAKKHDVLTLVYAAKDPRINHAVVLRDYLAKMLD